MRPFVSTNATTTKGARFPHNMGTFTLRATTTFLSIGFSSSRGRRRKGGERGGKGAARNSIRRERHTNAVGIVGNDGNGNNNSSNEPFTNDPKRKATDALLLSLLAGYSLQLLTRQKATAAFAKVNETSRTGSITDSSRLRFYTAGWSTSSSICTA